jgi:hypothetical protein
MYCSSCGAALEQGLSYCNYCGNKLANAKGQTASKIEELFPDSLVWAIVTIFIIGFGCTIGLAALMKTVLGSNDGMINAVILGSLLLTMVVEGVFIWLLLDRSRSAKPAGSTGRPKPEGHSLRSDTQHLALPQPAPSVTEQTTRSFEKTRSEPD